jgi:hypothetical protein
MTPRLKFIYPLLLCLLAPALGFAQGVPFRTQIRYGPSDGAVSAPVITVCTSSASLLQLPCQGLATIYTDATLTVQQANPFRGDKLGNVLFYASPGQEFVVSVTAPLSPGYSFIVDMTNVNALITGNNAWTGNETHSGTEGFSGPVSTSGSDTHTGTESFTGTVPANFYVATGGNGGSDSADCLAATVGGGHGPCLTVQHACDVAMSYFWAGGSSVINVGTGTFQGPILSGAISGTSGNGVSGQYLTISGNGAANTTLTDSNSNVAVIVASNYMTLLLNNLTISVPNNETGVFAQHFAVVGATGSSLVFTGGGTGAQAFHAEQSGLIEFAGTPSITLNGTWGDFLSEGFGGLVGFPNTIICGTTNAFASAFAFLDGGAIANFTGSFSGCGSVTGTRYILNGYSFLGNTTGSALPGNAIGVVTSGSRYRPSPSPSIAATTGLGSGGSAAMSGSIISGSHGGAIILTTGSSGTSSSGTITMNWGEIQSSSGGNTPSPCVAIPVTGAATWTTGATAGVNSVSTSQIQFIWTNGASTNLATSQTYTLWYVCGGDL